MIRKIFIGMLGILLSISILEFRTSVCFGQEKEDTSIEYEYDNLNRVIKAIYPDGTTVLYTYDRNGNLTETRVIQPAENEEVGNTTEEKNRGEADSATEESVSAGGSISTEESVTTGGFVVTEAADFPKDEYISELTRQSSNGRETDTAGWQAVFQDNREEMDYYPDFTTLDEEGNSASKNSTNIENETKNTELWWLAPIGAATAAGGYFVIRRKRNEA